ncbi:MAG: hypothetical protein ACP5UH_00500 [Candidatus Micrarchaeia archaeon]
MDYYDIVMDSCSIPKGFERVLGFKSIFVSGRDFKLADADSGAETEGTVAFGRSNERLIHASKHLAIAVIPLALELDRKLIETLKDNGTALLIPLSSIYTAGSDFALSRNMHLASKLLENASRKRVRVGFVTMARSFVQLESRMQLIELAKHIGANEDEARRGVSLAGELVKGAGSGTHESQV